MRHLTVPCTGRVDPVDVVHALELGYAGVAMIGCERKVCRYETGNWYAESRLWWTRMALDSVGIDPGRLMADFVSSQDRDALAEGVGPFAEKLRTLGTVGNAEDIFSDEVPRRLSLARRILDAKEVRWCMGQEVFLARQGKDCLGRSVDLASFRERTSSVFRRAVDESRILEALKDGPASLSAIASRDEIENRRVLSHIVDLIAAGLVDLHGVELRYPIFKACGGGK